MTSVNMSLDNVTHSNNGSWVDDVSNIKVAIPDETEILIATPSNGPTSCDFITVRDSITHATCQRPPNCLECLDENVMGMKCAINSMGKCVSLAEYDYTLDTMLPENEEKNFAFVSSANISYCKAFDYHCKTCTTRWQQQEVGHAVQPVLADYCFGQARECICVEKCVASIPSNVIFQTEVCPDLPEPTEKITTKNDKSDSIGDLQSLFLLLVAYWLFLFAYLKCRSRHVNQDSSINSWVPNISRDVVERRPPTGLDLNLTGWKGYQEALIEAERTQLAHTTNNSTATNTSGGAGNSVYSLVTDSSSRR